MRHPKERHRNIEVLKTARQSLSVTEKLLWERLKPSVSFQFNIKPKHLLLDRYTVDFFCTDLMIAFELEGAQPNSLSVDAAEQRLQDFEEADIAIVSIDEDWAKRNPNDAANFILDICRGHRTLDELDR